MYNVFHTTDYDKLLKKLDLLYQQLLFQFERRLTLDPYIGKPLGYVYFREKKFDDYRALFAVNSEARRITMLTIVDKRDQKEVINLLRKRKDSLRTL